jgi:hypothetical protein
LQILKSQNKLIFKNIASKLINCLCKNKEQKEILINIKYAWEDKIAFEIAKMFFKKGELTESVNVILKIIGKPNADWRITYRSFALLSIIAKKINDKESEKKWHKFTLLANQNFPLERILKSVI